MADEVLKRDQNRVTVLGGITDDSNEYVTMLRVDPTTKRLLVAATGGSSSVVWGAITGTLSDQTDLQTALNLKANSNAVISSLNGLTAQTQTIAVGSSGTDFAISSSGTVHTFNLPDASTTARGVITTGTQTLNGVKTFGSIPVGPASNPTTANQLTRKAYVDAFAQGVSYKASCRVATTANITIATALNNGDTIDGVVLATNDRVLVKDQTAAAENGIYVVAASPSRATDYNAASEVGPGTTTYITSGTANMSTLWVQTLTVVTLGTDPLDFAQLGSPGAYTFDADNLGTDFTVNVSGLDVTYSLPIASTTASGKITTSAQDIGGLKTFYDGLISLDAVGIGGTPDPSAILDLQSTTQGFGLPHMTDAQMLAIASPKNGLKVWNTDYTSVYTYFPYPGWIQDVHLEYLSLYSLGMSDGAGNLTPLYTASNQPVNYTSYTLNMYDSSISIDWTATGISPSNSYFDIKSSSGSDVFKISGLGVMSGTVIPANSILGGTSGNVLANIGELNTSTGNAILNGNATYGTNITALGVYTGRSITGNFNSSYFGAEAGTDAYYSYNSTFTGAFAGSYANNASNSIFTGYQAGYDDQVNNRQTTITYAGLTGGTYTVGDTITFTGLYAGVSATGVVVSDDGVSTMVVDTLTGSLGIIGYSSTSNVTMSNGLGVTSYYTADQQLTNITYKSSILIGDFTSTGGFSDSIAMGYRATNTATNQFIISPGITDVTFPYLGGGGSGYVAVDNNGKFSFSSGSGGSSSPNVKFTTMFESSTRWSTNHASGTATFNQNGVSLDTTSTGSRRAHIYTSDTVTGSTQKAYAGSPSFSCSWNIKTIGTTGHSFCGIGDPSTAGPTSIVSHAGFFVETVAGVTNLYASNSNGTTNTTSSSLTTVSANDVIDVYLKINGTSSIDYYWRQNGGAWSSATNQATNIPTANEATYMSFFVANTTGQFVTIIQTASLER